MSQPIEFESVPLQEKPQWVAFLPNGDVHSWHHNEFHARRNASLIKGKASHITHAERDQIIVKEVKELLEMAREQYDF